MKVILIFFLCVFSLSSFGQNVTDSKGKKQGPWSKTYPNSKVYQYKGQFKDDKPVGTFTYFYPSTKVKAIIKHSETSTRSEAFYYHENGSLMSHGIYRNMKKDSIWLNFGPSGRISNYETYKNDLLDGKKVIYYVPEDPNDNSKIVSGTYIYSAGKLNGEVVLYFENGTVKEKGTYLNNKKHGIWERYHSNGKKMNLERFKNGVTHGWCESYDEAGKLIVKSYFYQGKRLKGKALEEKMAYFKSKGINPND